MLCTSFRKELIISTLSVYRNMYLGMSYEDVLKSEMIGMGKEAHNPSIDIC